MGTEYHKIDSVYKRDEAGQFLIGEYAKPEFEYLKDSLWDWTEKIDGTNIRIMYYCESTNAKHYSPYDGYDHYTPKLVFGGKTSNAQIPSKLVKYLQETFSLEQMESVFGPAGQNGKGLDTSICLYGEGYGAGIQSGGNYSAEQKFILFDVKIGDWWLERKNIVDIAEKLGIDVVPLISTMSLDDMLYVVKNSANRPRSYIGTATQEGYVGTPSVPLFNRKGERIITKIKYKDFGVA